MKRLSERNLIILVICSFAVSITSLIHSVIGRDPYYLFWFVLNVVACWSFLAKCLSKWFEIKDIK